MSKTETPNRNSAEFLNVDYMRSLVKQYSELGQWTSAFFWADAAAAVGAANGVASGDDIWLLASALLSRGEHHRAAHAVVSRELHRRHLLCLGVAMRAYLAAKEPTTALSILAECDQSLYEHKPNDPTHNRALSSVLVSKGRALVSLERREAAAAALADALRVDVACIDALDLLVEQHALTPRQEKELLESLPIDKQLGAAEAGLLRATYRERLHRYTPLKDDASNDNWSPLPQSVSHIVSRASRQSAACRWAHALRALDALDPWCAPEIRATCLLELGKSSELFVLAHQLVNNYPHSWTAWFAVGLYYYLIGKSVFARRYLSKAKSLDPNVGCVWLAYGHSFAADKEHDQAMAAYFKASQLMPGCHLPALYVGVECSLLNNTAMAKRFLLRAALLHSDGESPPSSPGEWWSSLRASGCGHVCHEAGAAALADSDLYAAYALWITAVDINKDDQHPRWAATLDALGHVCRRQGRYDESISWHERALAVRPQHAPTYTALGLALALAGRGPDAADALHAALARDPDDPLPVALLDSIVNHLDVPLDDEDIPQFPFPAGPPPPAAPAVPATPSDTITSEMSMSFD